MADGTDGSYIPDGPNTGNTAEDVRRSESDLKALIKKVVPAFGFLSLIAAVINSEVEVKDAADYGLTNGNGDPTWVYNMFTDPVEWVEDIIRDLIFNTVLEPIGSALWDAGVSTVDSFIVIIFGTDRAIGVADGSQFGLLDAPFAVVNPIVGFLAWTTTGAVGIIASVNDSVAAAVSSTFGIAAPIVFNIVVVGEISAAVWAGWVLINAVDIPVVRVVAILKTATAPWRRFLGWFK